jgi:cytochrome c556
MDRKRLISFIVVIGVLGTCLTAISAMSQTKPEEGMNLLFRREMWCLEEAFEAIIDGIIFDTMELINPTIPPLHKAREKVETAMNAGEKIILPKNHDKFKEFIKLDDKFHKDFEALLKLAGKSHKEVVKDQTYKIMDACVVCHERFRK